MVIRSVNSLSHFTDRTIGHVHAGALGWVALLTFGTMYKLVPWVWKREGIYSLKLEAWHFWLALSGTLIYVGAMWNMWYYPISYVARAIGGLLYFLGAVIGAYNIYMTVKGPLQDELPLAQRPILNLRGE